MKNPLLSALAISLLAFLSGCSAPRITAPRSTALFEPSPSSGGKIAIASFEFTSTTKPVEEKRTAPIVGTRRAVQYKGQAREFIASDINDYIDLRFAIDQNAERQIKIDLIHAYSFGTMRSSARQFTPFVGGFWEIAYMYSQQIPIYFIAELKVSVINRSNELQETELYYFQEASVSAKEVAKKQDGIYRDQLNAIRASLVADLDALLVDRPKDPQHNASSRSSSSQILRLKVERALGNINDEEYERRLSALPSSASVP